MSGNEHYSEGEILTPDEAAKYLKLPENTLLKLVENNEIPFFKSDSELRFIKPLIDDWILSKQNFGKMNYNDITKRAQASDYNSAHISSFIEKEFILMNIKSGSKEDVLRQLVKPLLDKKIVYSEDFYLLKLIERENNSSTGIGHGLAIPHIKNIKENSKNSPYIVFGICKEGTDFAALDGKPTYLFFLLCSQSQSAHLKVMAKIGRMFNNEEVKNRAINAGSIDELFDILKDYNIDDVKS